MRPTSLVLIPILISACTHTSSREPIKCHVRNLDQSAIIVTGDSSTNTKFIIAKAGTVEEKEVELLISTLKGIHVVKFLVASRNSDGSIAKGYYSGWDYADGGGFGFQLPKPDLIVRCFPKDEFRY